MRQSRLAEGSHKSNPQLMKGQTLSGGCSKTHEVRLEPAEQANGEDAVLINNILSGFSLIQKNQTFYNFLNFLFQSDPS